MGKAVRWLKGLLGMRKDKENVEENSIFCEKKEKRRWSFAAKHGKDSGVLSQIPVNVQATDTPWPSSYISGTQREQKKHAMAVAAATAAAAEAAVAAAQAAVAVVRLTRQGRGPLFTGGQEMLAAVKIQAVFRGYLARKCLRALKGLVKFQALVRGYLVRKRTAAMLHSMQALVRVQAAIRSQMARRSINNDYRYLPEMRTRKSIERLDGTRSEFPSKRLSDSYDLTFDESPKIVEIDTGKPKSRSRRFNIRIAEHSDDECHQMMSSPRPPGIPSLCKLSPPRIHLDCQQIQHFNWGIGPEYHKSATAQNTPRCSTAGHANSPVKIVYEGIFCRPYSNCPNFMMNTQSFRAKLRSQSAPKHRPEPDPKKRLSLNEVMASRSSFSGVRMQKPCSQVREEFYF